MITTCQACQARYRLDASKVPARLIRVRCPDCGAVFQLDGTRRDAPAAAPPATSRPAATSPGPAAPAPPPRGGADDLVLEPASAAAGVDPGPAPAPAGEERESDSAPAPAEEPAARRSTPAAGVATAEAETPRPPRRRRRDKNEMLARALVSDILVYNRETRDQALAGGNLLEALGGEIKKSWELYKEKVGTETATSTSYFKDALNDILAEGQQVF
jgi:predicted Zn finger-like uncharacterized protein